MATHSAPRGKSSIAHDSSLGQTQRSSKHALKNSLSIKRSFRARQSFQVRKFAEKILEPIEIKGKIHTFQIEMPYCWEGDGVATLAWRDTLAPLEGMGVRWRVVRRSDEKASHVPIGAQLRQELSRRQKVRLSMEIGCICRGVDPGSSLYAPSSMPQQSARLPAHDIRIYTHGR